MVNNAILTVIKVDAFVSSVFFLSFSVSYSCLIVVSISSANGYFCFTSSMLSSFFFLFFSLVHLIPQTHFTLKLIFTTPLTKSLYNMLSIINRIYSIYFSTDTLKQIWIKQCQIITSAMHYAFIFYTSIFRFIIMNNTF